MAMSLSSSHEESKETADQSVFGSNEVSDPNVLEKCIHSLLLSFYDSVCAAFKIFRHVYDQGRSI